MGTLVLLLGLFGIFAISSAQDRYYGKYLGDFINQEHKVNGRVFAADARTLVLVNFTYDGAGPDAFFWVGKKGVSGPRPSTDGIIIPDENGNTQRKLEAYDGKTLILRLPSDLPLNSLQWISVWCRRFSVNFGYLILTDTMTSDLPSPKQIGKFSSRAHGVSSGEVTVLNAKTIRIQNLRYDGNGPDAFFLVGTGSTPSISGTYYKVPDETGSTQIIHGYTGQSIELTLPDRLTVFDIDWLSLYCITYTENFGEVFFPHNVIRRDSIPPHLDSLPVRVDGNHGRQGRIPQNNNNRNRDYGTQNTQQHNQGFVPQNGIPQNGRQNNQGYVQSGHNHIPGSVGSRQNNQNQQGYQGHVTQNGRYNPNPNYIPPNGPRRSYSNRGSGQVYNAERDRFSNSDHIHGFHNHNHPTTRQSRSSLRFF